MMMALDFNQYATEGNTFLKDYAKHLEVGQDLDKAGRICISILHALREIISVEESMQFMAQLPMFLKAAYVNGWNPKKRKERVKNMEKFVELIKEFDGKSAINDFGYENDLAERYIYQTFIYLRKYVSMGELEDIRDGLPKGLKGIVSMKITV
ncbi:DUF2267 domain-containing protein [Flagellimonas beolgyonensis]|jgi:uncharacterized protein (DUF2267 family)|uniref:DUF2267 domain-containing protein n=1 Tax=Flagellimonas beolgyonensis TaxID=864064 RepID=UPI001F49A7FB|nr:DUF2267 domain-containing protein [Allomuricauda beolgyonensis]